MQWVFTSLFSKLSLAILSCLIPVAAKAQVTTDGTTATTVNQDGNNYTVEQGDRVGDNLFHSFNEFSVPTGGSAGFNNAADVANIFSRVTGGDISNIDGLLSASGAANLYLINPNGIIFGKNARLDIGGSFFASTADSLLFEGDTEFSAVNPQAAPLLEVSIPIGASFRDNPGDIVNRSVVADSTEETVGLEVLPGQKITLLGGNLNFDSGNLTARGGNVELGGLSQARIVGVEPDNSLTFPTDVAKSNVTLANGAGIDVAGTGGGNVTINAQNLNLQSGESGNSSIRTGILSSTSVEAQAGNILIDVDENISLNNSGIFNQVFSNGVGNSGNIFITSASLKILNGGEIDTGTFGIGDSGLINIIAREDVIVDGVNPEGSRSGISSGVGFNAEGNAGGVKISASNLSIINTGRILTDTFGRGNGGNVDITVTDNIVIDGSNSQGSLSSITSRVNSGAEGNGGELNISTNDLNLTNGGQIDTSTVGSGNSGIVNITAKGNIIIDGVGETIPNGFFDDLGGGIKGDSSGIVIESGESGNPFVTEDVNNVEGNAGELNIFTTNLTLTNDGNIRAGSFDLGDVGDITIVATGDITIDGDSSDISNQSTSPATENAGDINISTANLTLTNGGQINSGQSDGAFGDPNASVGTGTIDIVATRDITVDGENSSGNRASQITSQTTSSATETDAGEINISTANLNLTNGGQINADTSGEGVGGDININATKSISISGTSNEFVSLPGRGRGFRSGVFSNTRLSSGDGGNVNVFADRIDIKYDGAIEASNVTDDIVIVGGFGVGQPGDIIIEANSLELTDSARINAITQSPEGVGGIINLQVAESIIFENNSFISAEAINEGNGGNLSIDTDFIIAFPNSNNDIVASAEQGQGGNININAEALFGIEERPLNPNTNDINASSEFSLDGTVEIDNPAVDPTTGLINLPASVGDASDQISQNPCQQGVGSEFIITGKGGVPPSPTETLNSNRVEVDLVEPLSREGDGEIGRQGEAVQTSKPNPENQISEAVPAMGWMFNDRGEVTLIADSNTDTKIQRSPSATSSSCSTP